MLSAHESGMPKKRRGGAPEQQPAYQPNRCLNCIKVKVKCSGGRPCARCFRLCLKCLPRSAVFKGKSYIDLAIQQLDIGHLNECYMKALNTFKVEGTLDRHKTIQTLHSWRGMSVMAGCDVSRGLYDAVFRLLDVSHMELEGHESVAYDSRNPSTTRTDAQVLSARRASETARLKQTQSFRQLDDGSSVLVCALFTSFGIVTAFNDLAAQWFTSKAEIEHLAESQQILHIHVAASMVDPSDRLMWYQTILTSSSANQLPYTSFIKLCTRHGDIDVYIAKSRSVEFPEYPGECVCVYTFERVPATTKHVSKWGAGYRKNAVIREFKRKREHQGDTRCGSGGGSRADLRVAIPGMACLPLFPPPQPAGDEPFYLHQPPPSHSHPLTPHSPPCTTASHHTHTTAHAPTPEDIGCRLGAAHEAWQPPFTAPARTWTGAVVGESVPACVNVPACVFSEEAGSGGAGRPGGHDSVTQPAYVDPSRPNSDGVGVCEWNGVGSMGKVGGSGAFGGHACGGGGPGQIRGSLGAGGVCSGDGPHSHTGTAMVGDGGLEQRVVGAAMGCGVEPATHDVDVASRYEQVREGSGASAHGSTHPQHHHLDNNDQLPHQHAVADGHPSVAPVPLQHGPTTADAHTQPLPLTTYLSTPPYPPPLIAPMPDALSCLSTDVSEVDDLINSWVMWEYVADAQSEQQQAAAVLT